MKIKCKKHPKYKGILKPFCNCEKCWRYFLSIDRQNKPKEILVNTWSQGDDWDD